MLHIRNLHLLLHQSMLKSKNSLSIILLLNQSPHRHHLIITLIMILPTIIQPNLASLRIPFILLHRPSQLLKLYLRHLTSSFKPILRSTSFIFIITVNHKLLTRTSQLLSLYLLQPF